MKLLLDTHVWLWRLLEPARIAPRAAATLSDPANDLHLSPISTWETLVLARKGRLELDREPQLWVREALRRSSPTMAPLTHSIAMLSEGLAGFGSSDPADRFLVATALEGRATLVTADRHMLGYDDVRTLAAA